MKTPSLFIIAAMLVGCSGSEAPRSILSQLANDPCAAHTTAATCGTGCEWVGIGTVSPGSTGDDSGVCITPDPCRVQTDEAGCLSAGCAWAGIEGLCPAGGDCNGGFCYTPTDDSCVCACPALCPEGADCPPCACDCDGGGTTCTCESPACAPGEVCPPSTCECGGSGCSDEGTCTCACPACEPGEACPPCDCSCDDGTTPTPVDPTDPCAEHGDEASCSADGVNACSWLAIGMPCAEGEVCATGVCQHLEPGTGGGSGGSCGCACPGCAPGEACPPCECGPIAGTGSGGSPGTPGP
jgi:hypothetical protein